MSYREGLTWDQQRESLLAELELMATTGREAEAYWRALQLLSSRVVPGSVDNNPNPLLNDWKSLDPYINLSQFAAQQMRESAV